ncbi:MAG TPA: TonB-dependent receptor [Steroidobacteraceae bacterium]
MRRIIGGALRAPVSIAVSLALASAAGFAHAAQSDTSANSAPTQGKQQAKTASNAAAASAEPTGSLQEIVITGIVGSIENSLQAEKFSNDIVEVVSAEDLGKLPNPSIAGSLARLPGVLAERGGDGFSDNISIRGLSPDFVGTLVNGRVQATTGENWGVSFNQIPAELVSGATVYLTPDAELVGQGLSGTIDVHTVDPLKYGSRKLTLTANGSYLTNDRLIHGSGVGRAGDQVSGTYIDQFRDHTIGVAVGVEHSDTPIQEQTYQNWWWSIDNGPNGIDTNWGGPTTPGMPQGVVSQEGMQARAKSELWERNALMGIIDFAPSDSFHSKLNLFYSTVGQKSNVAGLQWSSSPWDNISYSNVGTIPTQPYPLANSGTVMGLKPIIQNEYTHIRYDLMSLGWTNDFRLADDWRVSTDLSYSRATESLNDAYAFTGLANGGTLDSQFSLGSGWGFGSFTPSVNLDNAANLAFTDPDNYGYNGRLEQDYQLDRIFAAKIEIAHPLGWIFSEGHMGFYDADRKKTKRANVFFAFLNGNGSDSSTYQNNFSAPIGSSLLMPPISLGYAGIGNITNYNVRDALASQFHAVPENSEGDWDRNYSVSLKTPTAYLMADIDTDLGSSFHLRGNVGAQLVHTEQSSVALQTTSGSVAGSLRGGTTYNNFLPSLNLVLGMPAQNYLRLGIAKEMVYGRIDDIRASASAGVSRVTEGPAAGQVLWSGSGGNPRLRPYVALGYDLGWTKYFGRTTYLQLDAFDKKLLNYIYDQTLLNYDFTGYTNANPSLVATNNIGSFSEPENGTGGKLYGGTVAGGFEFGRLLPFARGLGVEGSFTRINSNIPTSTISQIPGGPQTLPGLSRDSGSLTVYYERGGFSARLAEIYRSSYTGEAVALFDQLGYTKVLTYKEADFQANYAFNSGTFNGLTLLLDVSNLTNAPYRTEQVSGMPNNVMVPEPLEFDTWGRTVSVGFRYSVW